jgi:hypothetical protein
MTVEEERKGGKNSENCPSTMLIVVDGVTSKF